MLSALSQKVFTLLFVLNIIPAIYVAAVTFTEVGWEGGLQGNDKLICWWDLQGEN